jgi:hypothetical protein
VTNIVQVAEAAGLKHVPLPDFDGDFRDQKTNLKESLIKNQVQNAQGIIFLTKERLAIYILLQ